MNFSTKEEGNLIKTMQIQKHKNMGRNIFHCFQDVKFVTSIGETSVASAGSSAEKGFKSSFVAR